MTDNEIYERISLLEAQVRFLAERLDVDLPNFAALAQSDVPPEIKEMVARGDKLGAIKAYRAAAGVDMATAMRVIDSL